MKKTISTKPARRRKTGSKVELYLNPSQVKDLIKEAEATREVIVIRYVRKTEASKPGGPDKGELMDLHCGTKPAKYRSARSVGLRSRQEEDEKNLVLTVFATNRQDPRTGSWGAWRRVNLNAVKKVIYKTHEYEVTCT